MNKLTIINSLSILLIIIFLAYSYNQKQNPVAVTTGSKNIITEEPGAHKIPIPDEYRVEVFQVGGHQIREFQITAWLTTEEGYLNPGSDYAYASINKGGDYVWLSCLDDYSISECEGGINPEIDKQRKSCSAFFKDVPKTRFSFLCSKMNNRPPN